MKTKTLAMKTQRPHSLKILAVSLLLSVIASSAQETGSLPTVTMAANNSAPGQDLFVSEANGSVAKISPDGAQSIFAAGMKRPLGLAVDRAGNPLCSGRIQRHHLQIHSRRRRERFCHQHLQPFCSGFRQRR